MALTRPRLNQLRDSDFKNSCRVVQAANITLLGGTPATVDGVNLQVSDRVLVVGQTDASENGVYIVSTLGSGSNGSWTRALDFNSNATITSGIIITTTEGDTYASKLWRLTTPDPITVGTTNLSFVSNLSNSNINLKKVTISNNAEVIDSISLSGVNTVRWMVSANDTVNSTFKTTTVDAVTNGTSVTYSEHGVLQSTTADVVELSVAISNGNIELTATGDSANCEVVIQRITLGSGSTTGFVGATVSQSWNDITNKPDLTVYATLSGTETLSNKTFSDDVTVEGTIISSPTTVSVGNSATVIDSFSSATYRGAKYIITIRHDTEYNIVEALLVHNGTTATVTVYGEVATSNSLGDISANISSSTVQLIYTGTSASNHVKVASTYITV